MGRQRRHVTTKKHHHRHPSQTERDIESKAARDEREAAQEAARRDAAGDDVPVEVTDEVTGQYEGDDLKEMRAKRTTGERLERLEDKHDALVKDVTQTRVDVGEIKGQLSVLPELVSVIKGIAEQGAAREHVTFTAQVDVDTAAKKADVLDQLDAKKARRAWKTKIITALIGAATSGAVLHWVLGRL